MNNRIRKLSIVPCPGGYFCPSLDSTVFTCPVGANCLEMANPCPAGSYCPEGSQTPIPCPSDAPGLLLFAGSLAACYIQGGVDGVEPTASAGARCSSHAGCPSGACRGGYCCSPSAKALGCATCSPPFGSCHLSSPGEPCVSGADCGTNLCAGGCCCAASALLVQSCVMCACWSNATTSAATAGACLGGGSVGGSGSSSSSSSSSTVITYNIQPGAHMVVNEGAAPRCHTCEAFDASLHVDGLFILPGANPLNPTPGVDLAVGLPSSCASLSSAAAAQGVPPEEVAAMLPCLARPAFLVIDGVNYAILGPAAPLRLAALPEGCSGA